jgi:hypothetical protein
MRVAAKALHFEVGVAGIEGVSQRRGGLCRPFGHVARDTPIWRLEASLKCRSCRKGRYAPPAHMIRLTETQQIRPYKWVRPDEER